MAKPEHVRVTFNGVTGTVAAPLEQWSFGVCFPADSIPDDSVDSTVDDALAASCSGAFEDNWFDRMTTDNILTQVKVSRILANGHVATRANGSLIQGEWNGEIEGEFAPTQVPLQTALCVSLTTARAGATGKGRFFLPWGSDNIDAATKRLSEAQVTLLAGKAKDFLNDLAVLLTFPAQVVSSKGYMSEVTGVRVGRAPDTMRSRREKLPEGYVAVPLS